MGQQLCSSPTEGFIIHDTDDYQIDDSFFKKLVDSVIKLLLYGPRFRMDYS